MVSQAYQPWVLKADVRSVRVDQATSELDIAATGSEAGDSVILRVVNRSAQVQPLVIQLESFRPKQSVAKGDFTSRSIGCP